MVRAAMHFRHLTYGRHVVRIMEGDEPGYCEGGPLLVSIKGPGLPRVRVTNNGLEPLGEDDCPSNGDGLIVFGHSKADRPRLGWAE